MGEKKNFSFNFQSQQLCAKFTIYLKINVFYIVSLSLFFFSMVTIVFKLLKMLICNLKEMNV